MVDIERLRDTIKDRGIKMVALSQKAGIDRPTLYNRLKGVGEFTASEILGLTQALRLEPNEREAIFFAKKVE